MSQLMKGALAELLGLFCFTFVGAGAICTAAANPGASGLVAVALAHGMMMAINVAALGQFSGGHFNPAVSVALWINGRSPAKQTVAYIVAQVAGAFLAAAFLKQVFPAYATAAPFLGATLPGAGITPAVALWVEIGLTFVLMLAIYGTAVAPRGPRGLVPFAVGGAIAVDILLGGPLTGASMNPARTLGPALATGNFSDLWVYLVGPVIGALVAGWVSESLLLPGGKK